MNRQHHSDPKVRNRQTPYLFAYDITDPRRARRVRHCLQRWRSDGQYSVHETDLLPYQARELTTEIVELMDRDQDRLLVGRLSRRGSGPIRVYSQSPRRPQLITARSMQRQPLQLQSGWYVLAYDIVDPQRLQKVQREAAKHCIFAQRSVYIYNGPGVPLQTLLEQLQRLIKRNQDDLRVYCLSGPQDLWFPSGPLPPLAGLATQDGHTLWQRLLGWLRVG